MLAKLLNLTPGEFIWTGGDCHIYHNHFEQVKEQVQRKPQHAPTLSMPDFKFIEDVAAATPKEFNLLEGLDLEEYFITSKVKKIKNTSENKMKIEVKKSTGHKCTLCWKILEKK